jgi:hypothetical protein
MSDRKETKRLQKLQEEVAPESAISAHTLRRLHDKIKEYIETHRAFGRSDDLLNILKDDL